MKRALRLLMALTSFVLAIACMVFFAKHFHEDISVAYLAAMGWFLTEADRFLNKG